MKSLLLRHCTFVSFCIAVFVSINIVLFCQVPGYVGSGFFWFDLIFAVLTATWPFVAESVIHVVAKDVPASLTDILQAQNQFHAKQIEKDQNPFFWDITIFGCGLVTSVIGFISLFPFINRWDSFRQGLFEAWCLLFFFGYGMLGCLYASSMVLLKRVSQLDISSKTVVWPTWTVKAIYWSYFRLFAIGCLLYIAAIIAVWVSPGGQWIARYTYAGQLWVFPPGLMVIIFFIYFNYYTHSILSAYRTQAEKMIDLELDKYFSQWSSSPSEVIEKRIKNLFNWRSEVRSQKTWVLDFAAMLATITTVLLPTIKAIWDLAKSQ